MRLSTARLMSFRITSFLVQDTTAAAASDALRTTTSSFSLSLPRPIGPFTQEQTRIFISSSFNRRVHPDALIENAQEDAWQAHKQQNPHVFNATKFRLHQWEITKSPKPLHVCFGLTDYKTYLSTCCSSLVDRLTSDGVRLFGDACAFVSRKVGVSGIVETSDQQLVFLQRSKRVGVYQGLYDTPGGHPEPSHLSLCPTDLQEKQEDAKWREQMETEAVHELFASIQNEVHEEINVPLSDLSAPLLLGIVEQSTASTPSFVFYMKCQQSADQVLRLYQNGPTDQFESTQLQFLNTKQLHPIELEKSFTPAAQGSLALYRQWKDMKN